MKTQEIYQTVTDKIIALLEKVQSGDYQRAWVCLGADGLPARNATTQKMYRGVNQFLLSLTAEEFSYEKNTWLTYNQAKALNGNVKKGSKSEKIYFFKPLYIDKDNKKYKEEEVKKMSAGTYSALQIQKIPMLKGYSVFNISQVEGLPEEMYYVPENKVELPIFQRNEQAENLIKSTDANIEIRKSDKAYYSPMQDKITLPLREQFLENNKFYRTAIHELGHWTGHSSRLDRLKLTPFGSPEYAREELVAELTTAYICAMFGFENHITTNAEYIKSWLSVLKNDNKAIFRASSHAQKACDYIFSFGGLPTLENEDVALDKVA